MLITYINNKSERKGALKHLNVLSMTFFNRIEYVVLKYNSRNCKINYSLVVVVAKAAAGITFFIVINPIYLSIISLIKSSSSCALCYRCIFITTFDFTIPKFSDIRIQEKQVKN